MSVIAKEFDGPYYRIPTPVWRRFGAGNAGFAPVWCRFGADLAPVRQYND
jgi:hypothetical protein